mgnify:CR=1 FL=1
MSSLQNYGEFARPPKHIHGLPEAAAHSRFAPTSSVVACSICRRQRRSATTMTARLSNCRLRRGRPTSKRPPRSSPDTRRMIPNTLQTIVSSDVVLEFCFTWAIYAVQRRDGVLVNNRGDRRPKFARRPRPRTGTRKQFTLCPRPLLPLFNILFC